MKKRSTVLVIGLLLISCQENNLFDDLDTAMKQSTLLDQCPVSLYQSPQQKFTGDYDYCENYQKNCFKLCQKGDANKCFALGYSLQQKEEINSDYSEFLFAKSCQQGLPLGCTNRAAHINHFGITSAEKTCAFDTFKQTCEQNDEWGCAMYGMLLAENSKKDMPLAKRILKKTCSINANSDACNNAKDLLQYIEKREKSVNQDE